MDLSVMSLSGRHLEFERERRFNVKTQAFSPVNPGVSGRKGAWFYGLHCFQFSVPDLCVCFPSVQGLGSGAKSLPPFSTVPGQLPPVRLCARQTFGQAYTGDTLPADCPDGSQSTKSQGMGLAARVREDVDAQRAPLRGAVRSL